MLIRTILTLLLLCADVTAATWYVNPDCTYNGSGITTGACAAGAGQAGALNSLANLNTKINAGAMSDGDDILFKANSRTKIPTGAGLSITWHGSPSNPIVIGAYYGTNSIGLGGGARPMLDGDNDDDGLREGGTMGGAIRYRTPNSEGDGYVVVQDLDVRNVIGYGIELNGQDVGTSHFIRNCAVRNCVTYNTGLVGIEMMRTWDSIIENCTVSYANMDLLNAVSGSGIDVSAGRKEGTSMRNTVRNCTVYMCQEGIGLYQGSRYGLIENCVVYDCASYQIYFGNSRNHSVINNISYGTSQARRSIQNYITPRPSDLLSTANNGTAIAFDNEDTVANQTIYNDNYFISGNICFGTQYGIKAINSWNEYALLHDVELYRNILIDNNYNFGFNQTDPGWYDIVISGNFSFDYGSATTMANNYSPPGTTWTGTYGGNYFSEAVTGNADDYPYRPGIEPGDVNLQKQTSWRDITPGTNPATIRAWAAFADGFNPSGDTCIFALDPTSATLPATSGNSTIALTMSTQTCDWVSSENADWITITSGRYGTGDDTIYYSYLENTGNARSALITVAGIGFPVYQVAGSSPCEYDISPTSASFPYTGGIDAITVDITGAPCPWTAAASNSWISIVSGASGTDDGVTQYRVLPNTGDYRTGTINIAGHVFSVNQYGYEPDEEPVPYPMSGVRVSSSYPAVDMESTNLPVVLKSKIQFGAE